MGRCNWGGCILVYTHTCPISTIYRYIQSSLVVQLYPYRPHAYRGNAFYPDRPDAYRGNAYAREERERVRERRQGAGGRPE